MEKNSYVYQRGGSKEDRMKHRWGKNEAGFDEFHGEIVGKCPSGLSKDAEKVNDLLNNAIPNGERKQGYPGELYNIHNGVIYVAKPTNPGKSYHGYPWRNFKGNNPLPSSIQKALKSRAEDSPCPEIIRKFNQWLKEYGR